MKTNQVPIIAAFAGFVILLLVHPIVKNQVFASG
jgi:hypothetical protein